MSNLLFIFYFQISIEWEIQGKFIFLTVLNLIYNILYVIDSFQLGWAPVLQGWVILQVCILMWLSVAISGDQSYAFMYF